jgi:hypothetical protein
MARSKRKMKKSVKAKRMAKTVSNRIPKDLRPYVLRKFRSKDKKKRFVVVRLPKEEGVVVQAIGGGQTTTVREFKTPPVKESQVPIPVLLQANREIAIWWAGQLARRGLRPSEAKERGRRRRSLRKALGVYLDHLATKQVVQRMSTAPVASSRRKNLSVPLPYIFFYDPLCRRRDPVFTVHTAYCTKLDKVRNRIHKRGGTSWVVEATKAQDAVQMQMKEFEEDDKGYSGEDFEIHDCALRPKMPTTSKTVLGRVGLRG